MPPRLVPVIMLALLATLSTCRQAPAAAIAEGLAGPQITDDLGRQVSLAKAAARIISLSPAITETLFAIGCGEQIVLRDNWSDHPPAATTLPSVGSFAPGAESIVAARPDLLLTTWPPPPLRSALDAAGVTWAAFAPTDLAGVSSSVERVGRLCGQPERATRERQRLEAAVAGVRAAVAGRVKPRVFYEMDAGAGGRPYTVGRGSFGHDLIAAAGGINVFGDTDQPWLQVSAEAILVARPDVIVLADVDVIDSPQSVELVAVRPGWSAMEAVQARRIHPVHTDWVARPGPRVVKGLRQLASILHPGVVSPPAKEAAP